MTVLTPRQVELVGLLAQGQTNAQIAHAMGMAEQTAKNHVSQVLRRLGAQNRTEAVLIAAREGHVDLHIPSRSDIEMRIRRRRLVEMRQELGELTHAIEEVDALMDES